MAKRWPITVDLFSGCGAVTQALKRRHFNVVAGIENDPVAVQTFELNHPTVNLYSEDIRDFDPNRILRDDVEGNGIDLLVVCAPCQPFSSQANYDGKERKKELILESVKFVNYINPKLIFYENVPGLNTKKYEPLLEKLSNRLMNIDYILADPVKVDAADYGVPQRRRRCVMFAAKDPDAIPGIPTPTTPPGERKTINDQIGDLPSLESGERYEGDALHFARDHTQQTIERIKHVDPGGDRLEIPKRLWLDCHKGYEGHQDVLGRMDGDDVAPTLTQGCTDVYKGRFTHPDSDRAITLREAARLQTFPDDYRFFGSSAQIASQIGNAVPLNLIKAVSSTIRSVI